MVLYGLLVGLALKGSLDATYSKVLQNAVSWRELMNGMLTATFLQLLIFLVTLIRFVFGAYRVHEEIEAPANKPERWVSAYSFVGTLVLFVLFYIAGLSVGSADLFYATLVLVHCWDLIWFILPAAFSDRLSPALKQACRKFLIIDVFTIPSLILVVAYAADYVSIIGGVLMLLLATVDFLWLRKFYFSQAQTGS
jgi:hypothetical protein